MPRAYDANAAPHGVSERTYGDPAGSGWLKLAFVFSGLGSEQGLIASDLLGFDRDPLDPTRDVMAPMTTS